MVSLVVYLNIRRHIRSLWIIWSTDFFVMVKKIHLPLLVYTKLVDSSFHAFWLATETLNSSLFYAFLYQVIIPGSWIFALIVQIPMSLASNVKDNACVWINEGWLLKTCFLLRSAFVVAAMILMAGLYCRIIYTLWFKSNPKNQPTFQRRVSINKQVQHENIFLLLHWR